MAFAIIVLLVFLLAIISGGKIQNLKYVKFRFSWMVFIGLFLKVLTNSGLRYSIGLSDSHAAKLYILSFVFIAAFIILNSKLKGFVLVGLGLSSNLLAIAANAGRMPVKEEYFYLTTAPEEIEKYYQGLSAYNYIPTGPDTKLYYLCDIILMPHWIMITRVFSVGDILITIGAAYFVWTVIKNGYIYDKPGLKF